MPFIKRVLLLLFVVVIGFTANAEGVKSAKKMFDKSLEQYNNRNFTEAENLILKSISIDSTEIDYYLLLSDIESELNNIDLKIFAAEHIIAIAPDKHFVAFKMLGDAYCEKSRYADARKAYSRYQTFNVARDSAFIAKKLRSVDFAIAEMQKIKSVRIERLDSDINSPTNEYWPTILADDSILFFTRLIKNNRELPYERIFSSHREVEGWSAASELKISDERFTNEGTMCISSDGKLLFFTMCGRPEGFGSCDIYYSTKDNGTWSKPYNVGRSINTSAWESQPSFSADGQYLYFASNRANGVGGIDLWRSEIKQNPDGSSYFDEPQNLGNKINTPDNDYSPFIHADGLTLYFSSNGHLGFGGTDMFMSRFDGREWAQPQNLGYPLNSPQNDDGLAISPTSATTVFASNRDGSTDIYQCELPSEYKPLAAGYMKGFVIDIETNMPIEATISISELGSNIQQYIACDRNEGYLLTMKSNQRYALNIDKKGYLFYSEFIDIKNEGNALQAETRNFYIKPIKTGSSVVLENIFFDFNDYKLKNESKKELSKIVTFLRENPSLIVEISGHTDNIGSQEYNIELSEKRAKAIADFLSQQIEYKRLNHKGYGSEKPIDDNDTEEGRAKNRRSELKIIGIK